MIYPELLVSRLVTEELDDNECLVVSGCERFNDYTGYGGSFQWTGDVIDSRPRDNDGRISRQVRRRPQILLTERIHDQRQTAHGRVFMLIT